MRSLKVLVLEDSPFQLMAMHQILNACGVFDVLTAESVALACESLQKRGVVDIAVCDLHMEGADGLELIRHLAATGLARSLVVCSGAEPAVLAGAVALARQQGLRVLGCLAKPATVSAVHELLETYLQVDRSQTQPQVEELGCLSGVLADHLRSLHDSGRGTCEPKPGS